MSERRACQVIGCDRMTVRYRSRRPDDPRLRAFIAEYKNNPDTTPEFGASCLGGTSALATGDTLNLQPGAIRR